jgi:hypothetical protein
MVIAVTRSCRCLCAFSCATSAITSPYLPEAAFTDFLRVASVTDAAALAALLSAAGWRREPRFDIRCWLLRLGRCRRRCRAWCPWWPSATASARHLHANLIGLAHS